MNTYDQVNEITSAKLAGRQVVTNTKKLKNVSSNSSSHIYQTIWQEKVAGFMSHEFNSDFTLLTNNFISYQGNI